MLLGQHPRIPRTRPSPVGTCHAPSGRAADDDTTVSRGGVLRYSQGVPRFRISNANVPRPNGPETPSPHPTPGIPKYPHLSTTTDTPVHPHRTEPVASQPRHPGTRTTTRNLHHRTSRRTHPPDQPDTASKPPGQPTNTRPVTQPRRKQPAPQAEREPATPGLAAPKHGHLTLRPRAAPTHRYPLHPRDAGGRRVVSEDARSGRYTSTPPRWAAAGPPRPTPPVPTAAPPKPQVRDRRAVSRALWAAKRAVCGTRLPPTAPGVPPRCRPDTALFSRPHPPRTRPGRSALEG